MGENDLEKQPQKAGLPGGRIMFLAIPRLGLRIITMWEGTAKDSLSLSASRRYFPAGDRDLRITTSWRLGVPRFPHGVMSTFSATAAAFLPHHSSLCLHLHVALFLV